MGMGVDFAPETHRFSYEVWDHDRMLAEYKNGGGVRGVSRALGGMIWFCVLLGVISAPTTALSQTPLIRAHAHNDYMHTRPLLDALNEGFCSVEADIWLVDGELLVAHDLALTKPERTLQALYLDPLRERVRSNGGRVHRNGPTVTLLIDIKSDAKTTYAVLRRVLDKYQDMLTRFTPDSTTDGAVTIILSGNRPFSTLAKEYVRWCAMDGRLADLTRDPLPSVHLVPLVSQGWGAVFKQSYLRGIPAKEMAQIREYVSQAHSQGRRIRFWGIEDTPRMWGALYDAGIDLINTDNLQGLREYLLNNKN